MRSQMTAGRTKKVLTPRQVEVLAIIFTLDPSDFNINNGMPNIKMVAEQAEIPISTLYRWFAQDENFIEEYRSRVNARLETHYIPIADTITKNALDDTRQDQLGWVKTFLQLRGLMQPQRVELTGKDGQPIPIELSNASLDLGTLPPQVLALLACLTTGGTIPETLLELIGYVVRGGWIDSELEDRIREALPAPDAPIVTLDRSRYTTDDGNPYREELTKIARRISLTAGTGQGGSNGTGDEPRDGGRP